MVDRGDLLCDHCAACLDLRLEHVNMHRDALCRLQLLFEPRGNVPDDIRETGCEEAKNLARILVGVYL